MYYILHIPTGHYLLMSDRTPVLYNTIDDAKKRLNQICLYPKEKTTIWNEHNEDIGYFLLKSEFEIIEVDK